MERSERVFCAQLFGAFSLVVGYVYWMVAPYLSSEMGRGVLGIGNLR